MDNSLRNLNGINRILNSLHENVFRNVSVEGPERCTRIHITTILSNQRKLTVPLPKSHQLLELVYSRLWTKHFLDKSC